jgi:RNA polymerase sigma factor (sigma-70 family)
MSVLQPPLTPANERAFEPIATRQTLLERLKDWDDRTSWQDFFDTYWRLIYNVALKAGLTDAEAQEVVQETVIAVAKKIPGFKTDPSRGSFRAWLMRLTRWRIADQFRKRHSLFAPNPVMPAPAGGKDSTGSTDPIERVPDPAGDVLERVWDQEWEKNLVATALERIKRQVSPRQYQIFDLHVLQHLSVQDTARILRVSAAAVYMATSRLSRQLGRTLKALRRQVD